MKLQKEERLLANGFNQFNLVDENNLIVGVVAGFSNEQNLKNAILLENAPELLKACQGFVHDFEMDYMLNGVIVDNPCNLLVVNYDIAKKIVMLVLGSQ